MPLHCSPQHEGPHNLRLDDHIGGGGPTVREVARVALAHADEGLPGLETARVVLERSSATPMTTEEAETLIGAVESGRQYMLDNNYADDHDFPEDAMAATLLERRVWVDQCWAEVDTY